MGAIKRAFANNITTSGNLTALSAANLTGTIADARFPATLPAISGANLTGLAADFVKVASVKQTTEAASIAYTNSVISTTYDQYKIFVSNARCNTDNINWQFRVSFDNGSSYSSSSIYYRNVWATRDNEGNDSFIGRTGASGAMALGHVQSQGNAAGECGNYEITLHNPHSTINKKIVSITGGFFDLDGDSRTHFGICMINSTSAISGIEFKASSNNIQSGDITIYGLKT